MCVCVCVCVRACACVRVCVRTYVCVSHMQGLEGTVEKHSPSLGRDAQYTKVSRITRLPGYLTIQFVRFFVGRAGDSEEVVSKKILKVIRRRREGGSLVCHILYYLLFQDVKFPPKLDVYEFCSAALQEKLLPMRRKFKEVDEKKAVSHGGSFAWCPSACELHDTCPLRPSKPS